MAIPTADGDGGYALSAVRQGCGHGLLTLGHVAVGSSVSIQPRLSEVRSTPDRRHANAPGISSVRACVDGSGLARRIFTLQHWSEQPCVRPVCAVHMTAGHNALRGSGSGQQHAFDDAMAHVGCPDRRIDRRCIKCCSPSQPLRHAGLSGCEPVHAARAEGSL
jgi:hypothetical protein